MDYVDRIHRIRNDITKIRDEHYAKHDFIPVKKAYQSRKKKQTDSNYHLKQLCKHLKLKGPEVFDQRDIDIINDDIFNQVNSEDDEESTKIIWKELDNEARVEYIENFLARDDFNPPVGEDVKQEIVDLLQDGKLTRKSDIHFDEINGTVVEINILKFDEETNSYYLNLKMQEGKKKLNKRLKKIFC